MRSITAFGSKTQRRGRVALRRQFLSLSATTPMYRRWSSITSAAGKNRLQIETIVQAGQLPIFRNDDGEGGWLHRPNTILVDSHQLESGEAMSDDFKKIAAREIENFKAEYRDRFPSRDAENLTDSDLLREVMNTVGKAGKLGENVRCVVVFPCSRKAGMQTPSHTFLEYAPLERNCSASRLSARAQADELRSQRRRPGQRPISIQSMQRSTASRSHSSLAAGQPKIQNPARCPHGFALSKAALRVRFTSRVCLAIAMTLRASG